MGMGGPSMYAGVAPRTAEERKAFAMNPGFQTEVLGLRQPGKTPQAGPVQDTRRSNRRTPTSILGSRAPANGQSTGRSLIKDPVEAGSLLR